MSSCLLSSGGGRQLELTLEHSDLPNRDLRVGGAWGGGSQQHEKIAEGAPSYPWTAGLSRASEVLNTQFVSRSTRQGDTLHVFVMGDGTQAT